MRTWLHQAMRRSLSESLLAGEIRTSAGHVANFQCSVVLICLKNSQFRPVLEFVFSKYDILTSFQIIVKIRMISFQTSFQIGLVFI